MLKYISVIVCLVNFHMHLFFFLLYCMVRRVYSLLSSFCQCQFNLAVAKTIKSYPNLVLLHKDMRKCKINNTDRSDMVVSNFSHSDHRHSANIQHRNSEHTGNPQCLHVVWSNTGHCGVHLLRQFQ